ncbi:carbon-nitrogen family hydrolase [Sediminibacillus dalangtanensis]|uniref:Carbon-nitrogen family hydrolase n=1 Tax=Sediminibacillus dalangtanensis TaxID=2729421 RepID=A0ABX7VMK7_9BACI|nr:carbon-nitrogen family hydrolase [Sediminibacillus dalangtanensis]QTM98039.1 carbon-nitrogen family hydrolase [Sediminibacillus dalangtanensis]
MKQTYALIQMDIAFGDPQTNFRHAEELIREAVEKRAPDTILLPELWTTGYDLTRLDEIADEDANVTIAFLSRLAKELDINMIAGSVANRVDEATSNTLLVVARTGDIIKQYSKAHLFRLMDEEKYLIEGNSDGTFVLENQKSAAVICYDIRFPEWIRTHMLDDTKVLYVVAEWPKQRIDHWRALLISRAIENQCFVVACNRSGSDPNNEFGGNSMIIGPWGEVLAEAGLEETILTGTIDLEEVEKIRATIPIYSDRRTDLYKLK